MVSVAVGYQIYATSGRRIYVFIRSELRRACCNGRYRVRITRVVVGFETGVCVAALVARTY